MVNSMVCFRATGYSQIYKKDVINILPSSMLNTIYINIFSTLVALAITIRWAFTAPFIRAAQLTTLQVLSIVGYSIPVYIIALVFIWLFAVILGWLPVFVWKHRAITHRLPRLY